jgi:hypothetical protein
MATAANKISVLITNDEAQMGEHAFKSTKDWAHALIYSRLSQAGIPISEDLKRVDHGKLTRKIVKTSLVYEWEDV